MRGCKAHYEGGQMVCNRCGYVWDLDDERPECKTDDGPEESETAINVKVMNDIREILK